MTNQTIKEILRAKKITHLYHANTVETACTFLEHGGLMSRGYVEDCGLAQTEQVSDQTDSDVGVYYDIFFDSVDIHQRSRDLNKYGPVAFEFSVDLIDSLDEGCVAITKSNPIRWTRDTPEWERYFQNEQELRTDYRRGEFAKHLTIRNRRAPLGFERLERVILDDPHVEPDDLFRSARERLAELVRARAPGARFEVRTCPPGCRCAESYRARKPGYIWHKYKY